MESFLLQAGISEGKNIMKELKLGASRTWLIKLQLQGLLSLLAACTIMPSMFAWRLQCVQSFQKEKFLHLVRLLGKREWSMSTSSRRQKMRWWSRSQFAVTDLGRLWTADTIASRDKRCTENHRDCYPIARLSSVQVHLISMTAFVLKLFYFR